MVQKKRLWTLMDGEIRRELPEKMHDEPQEDKAMTERDFRGKHRRGVVKEEGWESRSCKELLEISRDHSCELDRKVFVELIWSSRKWKVVW